MSGTRLAGASSSALPPSSASRAIGGSGAASPVVSRAANRNASELLPAARFEIGSVSLDKMSYVQIIWAGAPSCQDVKRALAPLTAGGRGEPQLHHESALSRHSRLALRAAYQVLGKDLSLADTAEVLGAKLVEKLRSIVPGGVP
jgi:hypothetical protein